MSAVEDYQGALRNYLAAEVEAKNMMKLISDVSSCLHGDKFGSFLGWHFSINDQIPLGARFDTKARLEMDNWPSRDELASKLKTWHQSWHALQSAWNNLPQVNRVGFQEPPSKLK